MGTCGKPGYVFRDFCLKQGIEFIIFCLNQGNNNSVVNRVGKSAIFVLNRVRVWITLCGAISIVILIEVFLA